MVSYTAFLMERIAWHAANSQLEFAEYQATLRTEYKQQEAAERVPAPPSGPAHKASARDR